MKKYLSVFFTAALAVICFYQSSQAQSVTIDPSDITAGQIIDAKSTKKGLLIPRVTEAQRTALSTPVAGVLVYCTNCSGGAGTYSFNGSVWVPMFNTAGITYVVGQSAQGGKIFYVDDTGQHGLVVANADYASPVAWISASNMNTNALRNGIYGGQYNTDRINEVQANGISAASAAAQTTDGNYGDWYLPSKIELNLLYLARNSVGMGASAGIYWSSTEVAVINGNVSDTAYLQNFTGGSQGSGAKNVAYKVRAIRRF